MNAQKLTDFARVLRLSAHCRARIYKEKFFGGLGRRRGVARGVDACRLESLFAQHADNAAFVHAGLADIKSGLGADNPMDWLMSTLPRYYGVVLAPGFTPSFRTSGIYHKLYSRPEYGTFSKLFLDYATSRSNDAIHSMLCHGSYSFDGCKHDRSFGPESCFDKLDQENTLIINVGTLDVVFAQLHHIERVSRVPYSLDTDHKGVIYYDEMHHEPVTQRNYAYKKRWMSWNRGKIRRHLIADGVLSEHNLGGLIIRFFRAGDMRRALEPRIRKDPYYLIH